ncbi:MAG: cell division ATP-binding protein FtsE [Deltaproteobacteria bacterium]|nr:MAG: cell division ATP-binding protein FtsE [Deltaproteobacteria bacterium]
MIHVTSLSYAFGSHWALKDISFSLRPGEFLFLVGPSGAGKTTLMRVLHGALPVQRGRVKVAGMDLNTLRASHLHRLRREIGVVFQDFKVLPSRTVFDNVALPLRVQGEKQQIVQRRVRAVLRSLELDTRANCRCEELSGGEQQRVAIARSVVVKPKIILADEPTGNLDPELGRRLMNVFHQFNRHGTTIVFATHNRDILAHTPHANLLYLREGSPVSPESDSARELCQDLMSRKQSACPQEA